MYTLLNNETEKSILLSPADLVVLNACINAGIQLLEHIAKTAEARTAVILSEAISHRLKLKKILTNT